MTYRRPVPQEMNTQHQRGSGEGRAQQSRSRRPRTPLKFRLALWRLPGNSGAVGQPFSNKASSGGSADSPGASGVVTGIAHPDRLIILRFLPFVPGLPHSLMPAPRPPARRNNSRDAISSPNAVAAISSKA